jgi:hypothetical protein
MKKIKEQSGFKGEYIIEIIDTVTGKKEIHKLDNTLTVINQNIHLRMLLGDTTGFSFNDLSIGYFGFGTGTTPESPTQTKLVSENYRKQVTSKSFAPGTNFLESIVSLGSSEANFNIREIGVFAGSSATSALNTGNMISRIVVDIDKFENKIINIIRRDIVTIA